jgi:hypothetical protein
MGATSFEIISRNLIGDDSLYKDIGQYEFIIGRLYYSVDPKHPDSQLITDIDLISTNNKGEVEFSSDIQILKPVNMKDDSNLLFDVVNRGNRNVLGFNNAEHIPSDEDPDLGNSFLMKQGTVIVFCGWQTDVPVGRIRLHAPEALDQNGNRLTGQTYQQFDLSKDTYELLLSDREHTPLPTSDMDDQNAILIERDWPDGPIKYIPRNEWSFARWANGDEVRDANYICLPRKFESGKVYEIIYTTVGAPVIGLGFLAMRDCTSFFRYANQDQGNPCAGNISRAYAFGPSQSGRFVREFAYLGLNLDEQDRLVYDGLLPHTGSSRLGEFNMRFGQPSSNHMRNVGNIKALTYKESLDSVLHTKDSLLWRLEAKNAVPKIIATNSDVEYWWSGASLSHTDPTGSIDVDPPENVRVYLFSGTKHGAGSLPLTTTPDTPDPIRQKHFSNTLDYRPLQRAVFNNLDKWVREGIVPPDSKYPRIDDNTAVTRESLKESFEKIPAIGFLKALPVRQRLAFGNKMDKGIYTYPAIEEEPFGTRVSAIDDDCNEISGIRLPDLEVPLATHTGWALRHADIGGEGHFLPLQGSIIPFPRTNSEKEQNNDPRNSIESRYASKEDYLQKIRISAEFLAKGRYILHEDVGNIIKGASEKWDAIQSASFFDM